MRVLITGAAGFIGSHLADRLVESGHVVLGADSLLTGRLENYPNIGLVDITDRSTLYELANSLRPKLVIHCAASYSDPDLWRRDVETNISGCVNVAAVARHHGARVVYFQTVLPPTSSYAISKLAGEQYLRLSGVPLLVVKLANVYGPRGLNGPVAAFARRLLAGETCTVTNTSRDFVYIDDLLDILQTAVDNWQPGTMEVHSGIPTPISRIYELVAQALEVDAAPILMPHSADDVESYVFDGIPITPHWVKLEEGIPRTVAWYREHGLGETYTHLRVGA